MTEDQTIDGLGIRRRQALAAAAALCGFGAVAAASTGEAQAAGRLRVRLSRYPALKKVGGAAVVGRIGSTQVAVVRTARNRYVALDRRCPHAGGIVNASSGGWVCPLHGSRFDLDGDKVSGVTPTGLRQLPSKLRRGVLTITG
ncbi:MAG: ubiquinol-cytochrome c reductase iron-sulfur subunit [Candidatus Nanopelagicales bacterium]